MGSRALSERIKWCSSHSKCCFPLNGSHSAFRTGRCRVQETDECYEIFKHPRAFPFVQNVQNRVRSLQKYQRERPGLIWARFQYEVFRSVWSGNSCLSLDTEHVSRSTGLPQYSNTHLIRFSQESSGSKVSHDPGPRKKTAFCAL